MLGLVLFVLAGRAHAGALEAYQRGDYRQAIALGQAEGTARSLVLAARAHLVRVDLGLSAAPRAEIEAALKAAQRAEQLDPGNAEAHLLQASAYGYLGRRIGKWKSFARGLAPKALRQISAAIAIAPRSPWAYAMLGIWHLEIVRRGGAFGARMTGASAEDGARDCAYAAAAAPDDAALLSLCGLALLAVGKPQWQSQARDLLIQARDHGRASAAYDRLLQRRAASVLAVWRQKGLEAARQRAIFYQSLDGRRTPDSGGGQG